MIVLSGNLHVCAVYSIRPPMKPLHPVPPRPTYICVGSTLRHETKLMCVIHVRSTRLDLQQAQIELHTRGSRLFGRGPADDKFGIEARLLTLKCTTCTRLRQSTFSSNSQVPCRVRPKCNPNGGSMWCCSPLRISLPCVRVGISNLRELHTGARHSTYTYPVDLFHLLKNTDSSQESSSTMHVVEQSHPQDRLNRKLFFRAIQLGAYLL